MSEQAESTDENSPATANTSSHGTDRQHPDSPERLPRSSRLRYEAFRKAYKSGASGSLSDREEDKEDSKRATKEERNQYLRQYARWLWPHRWAIALVAFLALLAAGLDMIQPLFMRYIVDHVLLVKDLSRAQQTGLLNLAGAIYLGVVIVNQLLNTTKNYNQRKLNVRVVLALRRALYQRLLHLPLKSLSDMKVGGILSRLSGDIDRTKGLLQLAIISPSVSVVRLLIAMGILFSLNWRLALTAMAIIPGIMFISFIVANRIRPIYRAMRKDNAAIDARVSETFGGIRVVRAFQREVRELSNYLTGRHTVLRKELFAHRRELILWSTWGFILACVNVVIVWYGGYLQVGGSASVGDIMAFQWYTFLLLNPVWQIVNSFSELQRSLAGMERVFEVLGMEPDKPDQPHAIAAPRHIERMKFDGVTFAYNEGEPVLQDIDVDIPGGSVVALVGRSGAGKTTMTDLVARFQDPTDGKILLNGIDLKKFQLDTYRQLLAVVQQEVFLFDGSVRDNIAYGRMDATEDEIIDAAQRANAHEFIAELRDGYDSLIGERGVKLSGGQCQRLSIARAILADPQILILDEATSNLDTESEQLIQQSMSELLAGRTTFVIAHRLSTITNADLILVLDQGQIIERGTHDELMALGGLYRDMVLRQKEAMLEHTVGQDLS